VLQADTLGPPTWGTSFVQAFECFWALVAQLACHVFSEESAGAQGAMKWVSQWISVLAVLEGGT
jgi:hypothetical protein